jgi:hypothetical protein
MKKYNLKVNLYHGTSRDNAMSILANGTEECFFTTDKNRALCYGKTVLKKIQNVEFDNKSEMFQFNKRVKNDFYDITLSFKKGRLALYLIEENEKEEDAMLYFMWDFK